MKRRQLLCGLLLPALTQNLGSRKPVAFNVNAITTKAEGVLTSLHPEFRKWETHRLMDVMRDTGKDIGWVLQQYGVGSPDYLLVQSNSRLVKSELVLRGVLPEAQPPKPKNLSRSAEALNAVTRHALPSPSPRQEMNSQIENGSATLTRRQLLTANLQALQRPVTTPSPQQQLALPACK